MATQSQLRRSSAPSLIIWSMTGRLTAEDVEKIRHEALAELATGKGPIVEQARKLAEQEYP